MSEKPKYKPQEIPKQVQETIYTHYCLSGYEYGELKHYAFDATGENYICVAKTPIVINIPPVDNVKEKVVEALEKEKTKQEAEHFKKMFDLQEKINSLLCLTYEPVGSPPINETANDIPF